MPIASPKILTESNNTHGEQEDHTDIERALFIICMGDSAIESNYVERFVWSAREVGKFTGWVVLLTDAPEERYNKLSGNWGNIDNEKFAILRPEEEHYIRHYEKGPKMAFKQFKTYALQYLSQDSRLDSVSLVYYLDVDIFFGSSVWPLFKDLEQRYQIARHSSTTTQHSTKDSAAAKMWMFKGDSEESKIQGGVIILERASSQPCLERFRSLMDTKTSTIDQLHLLQMLQDQNQTHSADDYSSLKKCEIVVMSHEKKQLLFPTKTYIKEIADGKVNDKQPIPVLNHISSTGRDLIQSSSENFEAYLRYIFGFESGQEDNIGITKKTYLDAALRKKERRKKARENNDSNDDDLALFDSALTNITEEESHVDDVERAMFVISMGESAAKMNTVERFVYSARNNGKFSGWIVVLTDAPPDRYSKMANWTDNVIIMEPKEEHTKTHYKVSNMIYKRFKTYALEYMDRDSRLDKVELVYYLDVDIVFGDNMWKAFHGLEKTYGIGRIGVNSTMNNKSNLGRGKMWMFKGNAKKWLIQGGQMILDRSLSQPCLERWREGFDQKDSKKRSKDQDLLMMMLEEQEQALNGTNPDLECEIIAMNQAPHIEFPSVNEIRRRSRHLRKSPNLRYKYSPMVHVRNDGGTAVMKEGNIKPYMRSLLRFKQNQKDPLKLLKKVRMYTT
eukprot:jgi/Psemu1/199022/e_gw1.229.2.1